MSDVRAYLAPVEGPLRFIRTELVLPTGRTVGESLDRDPWIERDVLRPVFERDADGLPRFKLVYCEMGRGSWKSGAAAAIAVTECTLFDSTEVIVVAADRDQAAIVGDGIKGYLRANASLAASFEVRHDLFTVPARGSRIRIIASDEPSSWGLGGTHRRFRVLADELTAWPDGAMWESLASATGKVPDAQMIVTSNAGYDAARSWQWRVRETAEREDWGHLFSANGPIASWIDDAWIEQMRALLPGPAFDRVIMNRWTTQTGDFVSASQWAACIDSTWKPQAKGTPGVAYYGGLDLGLTRDATAFSIVHVDAEGRVVLDEQSTWQGSRADPVDVESVERAIVDAARRFHRLHVACDPWQMQSSMQRLRRGRVRIDEFVFSASSVAKLSQALYSAITSASLRVYPDAELEREVLGLQVVQTPSGWKVDHRAGGFSDRAISLALAINVAQEHGGRRTSHVPTGMGSANGDLRQVNPWLAGGERPTRRHEWSRSTMEMIAADGTRWEKRT